MTEIFLPVKGYEGLYEVSNFGNVKSLPKGDGNGFRERILVQEVYSGGGTKYRRVSLSANGIVKRFQVHRLVADCFLDNQHNKPFVNHIDNNGENNNVCNLEWCTHSENMIHAQKQGRLFESQKKGGIASSVSANNRLLKKIDMLVGKTFGKWKVKSFAGRLGKKRSAYLVCECTSCNKDYNVEMGNMIRGVSTQCRSCSLVDSHKKRRVKI